jgi:flagellar secretion chaperone FliS
MYVARGQFGAAKARYQRVDAVSRVEGASPHQLVSILYDELLQALDAMSVAMARRDFSMRGDRQARALRLLSGLETSLDFEGGGEIAAGRDNDMARVQQAREMLGEVSEAWTAIGRR